MHAWQLHGSAALAVALALACGGAEEKPQPSGAPMGGAPASKAASGENHAPVIERVRLEPEVPLPGGHVRALVQASDPDGGSLRLRYAWTLDGVPIGSDAPELTLERGRKGAGLALSVVASDGSAESAPGHARTELGNRGPLLTGVLLEPTEGLQVGGIVKAVPEAQDPDDDALRYEVEWRVNGTPLHEKGLVLDTRSLHRGDQIQVEARATDGNITTDPVTSRDLQIGNSDPKIVSRPETQFEGGVFQYVVEARDPDGDRHLRYSLVSAPEGMSIDRMGGEIRWQPRPDQSGKHAIEVAVEDGQGGKDSQLFEVTIGKEAGRPLAAPVPAAQAEP
jgi:hypothetical protein